MLITIISYHNYNVQWLWKIRSCSSIAYMNKIKVIKQHTQGIDSQGIALF